MPFLKEAPSFEGLMANLSCEVSASKARMFPLVDFIDTPGLVDGVPLRNCAGSVAAAR